MSNNKFKKNEILYKNTMKNLFGKSVDLELHGGNFEGLAYIFQPTHNNNVFYDIYLDLVRCNDLSFIILNASDELKVTEKLFSLLHHEQSNQDIGNIFDGNLKTLTPEEEDKFFVSQLSKQRKGFIQELYSGEKFVNVFSKSLVVGMIQFTFESALKKLIYALNKEAQIGRNINKNIISQLTDKLDDEIGNKEFNRKIQIEQGFYLAEFMSKYRTMTKIRNDFVHGNWDEIDQLINQINIVDTFFLIKKYLDVYQKVFDELKLLK